MHAHADTFCSEGVGIVTCKEVAGCRFVITNQHNHLVQLRSDLHAARQPRHRRVGLVTRLESMDLGRVPIVKLVKEGVRDVDGALSAVHTR